MKFFIILAAALALTISSEPLRIDFGQAKDGQDWQIIVDGVMGGLSQGSKEMKTNSLYFDGSVSLANNGGFSSCKAPFQATDLSAYTKLLIRCKGEGQAFAITLENDRRWFMPYYKMEFVPTADWQVIELPLADFDHYRIGQKIGKTPTAEDLAATLRLGITTNSKKEGPFVLEVDYIEFR